MGTPDAAAAFNEDTNNRQLHLSEIDWIKRNAETFAKQQGNLTEEQAITILTAQALYQVDLIWGYCQVNQSFVL